MNYCGILITSILVSITIAAVEAGEIHQWKDAKGQLHFGDRAPANSVSTVVKVKPNVYTSPSIEALGKLVQSTEQVVKYSASWCGYCNKARSYFTAMASLSVNTTSRPAPRGNRIMSA